MGLLLEVPRGQPTTKRKTNTLGNTEQGMNRLSVFRSGPIFDSGARLIGSIFNRRPGVGSFLITRQAPGDQARAWASKIFLTITRLASANRVCNCAVFLARPR